MLMLCNCPHKAQDIFHGKGIRVFNASGKVPNQVTCTVCGTKKLTITSTEIKETVKKGKK